MSSLIKNTTTQKHSTRKQHLKTKTTTLEMITEESSQADFQDFYPVPTRTASDHSLFGHSLSDLQDQQLQANLPELILSNSEGRRPIICKVCSKEFSTYSNLRQHAQIHESKEKRPNFNCPFCDKSYLYKCSLNKHIKLHSSDRLEEDNDSITTASYSSELKLEAKCSKKVKVEEDCQPIRVQSLPEQIKQLMENNGNILAPELTETITLHFAQQLLGGGFQNVKITIEPVGRVELHQEMEIPVNEMKAECQDYSAEMVQKNEIVCEETDFFERIFKTNLQDPSMDYGFQPDNY